MIFLQEHRIKHTIHVCGQQWQGVSQHDSSVPPQNSAFLSTEKQSTELSMKKIKQIQEKCRGEFSSNVL